MPATTGAAVRRNTRTATWVVEIRPGEGGDDAAAFAAELERALSAWSRHRGWAVQTDRTDQRSTTMHVRGAGADALVGFAGCHRVQRVPKGTTKRHTSTAMVAVLEETAATQVQVRDSDLDVTVSRGSGPGGQHRNKTESAVRVLHRPSGLVVTNQESRSQQTNLASARRELERRLLEAARIEEQGRRNELRVEQLDGAERPMKSFTHNTQRDQVIDHTSNRRWRLRDFQRGQLD